MSTLKERGIKAGLVFNPGTPLTYIEENIDVLDFIVIMTVNPGFAGQKMTSNALNKIKRARKIINDLNRPDFVISADGNTTPDNARKMIKNGANEIVVGSSSIMKSAENFEKAYEEYIQYIQN